MNRDKIGNFFEEESSSFNMDFDKSSYIKKEDVSIDYHRKEVEGVKEYTNNDYRIVNDVTDWYIVTDDINSSFVFPGPVKVTEKPVLRKYIDFLYQELQKSLDEKIKEMGSRDFREAYLRINLPNIPDLMIFRGNKIKTIEGECWALRRVKGTVPDLSELGMSRALVEVLTNDNLRSGLVLIVGETGNGKSTTCASVVKELCAKRGSFALTVEDPPELPLHGMIGKGVCLQTEVRKGGFAEAIRSAMRSYPAVNNSILYVGEIRDAETAKELIKISANGHLVFATIHGDSIITGIKRLVATSAADDGNMTEEVRTMLASSLRLVVHQKLKTLPTSMSGGRIEKKLYVEFLLSSGVSSQTGNALNHNKIDTINNVIARQQNMLANRGIKFLMEEEFYIKS